MSRKRIKNQINNEGQIYRVSPEHLVKKRDLDRYNKAKGNKANNPRPVMIAVQRKGSRVQISEMTTKATQEQISKKQKVKLAKTYPNKNSYVNTNTIGKSRKTGKIFKVGEVPLTNLQNKKVNNYDFEEFKKPRKKRGR